MYNFFVAGIDAGVYRILHNACFSLLGNNM